METYAQLASEYYMVELRVEDAVTAILNKIVEAKKEKKIEGYSFLPKGTPDRFFITGINQDLNFTADYDKSYSEECSVQEIGTKQLLQFIKWVEDNKILQ